MEWTEIGRWVMKFLQPTGVMAVAVIGAVVAYRICRKTRVISIITWVIASLVFIWGLLFFAWLIYALVINLST